MDFQALITENWAAIAAAPKLFVGLLAAGLAGGYWFARQISSGQLAQKDERIKFLEAGVTSAENENKRSNETINDLRKRLGLDPTKPDPYRTMSTGELQQFTTNLCNKILAITQSSKPARLRHFKPEMSQADRDEAFRMNSIELTRAYDKLLNDYKMQCRVEAMAVFEELQSRGVSVPEEPVSRVNGFLDRPVNTHDLELGVSILTKMAARLY